MVPFELALGFEAPADGVEGEGDAGAADVSLFLLAPAPKSLLKSPIELLWFESVGPCMVQSNTL